jgi:hypothetical protein
VPFGIGQPLRRRCARRLDVARSSSNPSRHRARQRRLPNLCVSFTAVVAEVDDDFMLYLRDHKADLARHWLEKIATRW